ncbi:MAG: hypothetical protein RLZZ440_3014 [Planctomycetota bacterium]
MPASSAPSAAVRSPLGSLLDRIRREARLWIWVESLAQVAMAAAVLGGGLFLVDWLLEPPAWARAAASALAAGLILWLLAARLAARLATPLSDASLALALERRHPGLGDALSTAVGLSAASRDPVDPELVARTTSVAASLAATLHPGSVFRRRRLVAVGFAGLGAIAAVAGAALTRPDLAETWARRLVLLEDVPWPRRVEFEAEGFRSGVRKVARGSDVDVVVRARAKGHMPESVTLRVGGAEGWRSLRMGTRGGGDAAGQTFGHVLERVMVDTPLEVRGGDGRLRDLRLEVVEPPAIADLEVRLRLPAYLGGHERRPPPLRVIPVPMGSEVEVEFRATKPLQTATVIGRFADLSGGQPERVLADFGPDAAGEPRTSLTVRLPALLADAAVEVTGADADGIAIREPFTLLLSAVPDTPPEVTIRLADASTAVTPAARLRLVGSITDDHGVAAAGVRLVSGDTDTFEPLPLAGGAAAVIELPAEAPAVVPLEPLGLAAGDRLEVTVTATDSCGLDTGPNTGRSDTWPLEVVTPDALRAMLEAREILLRRRYEAAIEDLSQTRRGLPAVADRAANPRLAEAAARAAGESREIAAAFRAIRDELDLNALLTTEMETRLVTQVADPVAALAHADLAEIETAARVAPADDLPPTDLAGCCDLALERMRAILARMLELESYNEVVEKLRSMIDLQESLRRETLDRQRRQAREALEGP